MGTLGKIVVTLLLTSSASADMARHESVNTLRPGMQVDPFRCGCPVLSSHDHPMKIGREQRAVDLLHVALIPRTRTAREKNKEEEIAALGIRTRGVGVTVGDGDRGGLVVTGILETGVAQGHGLLEGDIIVRLDDRAVHSSADLTRLLGSHEAGEIVSLTIVRHQEEITTRITLGVLQ